MTVDISGQIPRHCAPRDDRLGMFAGGIVSLFLGQGTSARLKILVDMNLSPSWVDRLAAAGFEAAGVLLSIDESSSRVHILPLKA